MKFRKIETKENQEKKESRNKTIIGIILAIIMLLSVAGYGLLSSEKTSESSGKIKYNGLEFYRQGGMWQTEISSYNFYFSYLPNETGSIYIKKTLTDYANKPLYFTGEGEAEQEIARNLYAYNKFVLRVQKACLEYENCSEDLPVKNCSDNVIIIEEKDFNNFAEEDNCVFIFSNNTLKASDAFLYKILGIK